MNERLPADHAAREAALDPGRSFIVQAPAGSGKTELLTRRFLGLLRLVDRPEEVLAITFTRKAAGEMRARILDALALAGEETPPEDRHRRRTWELARAALAQDRARGWNLVENPRRLRVETIDALNAWLARQLPVSSGLGAAPLVADDPRPAYRAAARRVLLAAGTDHPGGDPARALLAHLGNRFTQAQDLLVELLARRDHWLHRLLGQGADEDSRDALESAVRHFLEKELERVHDSVPAHIRAELGEIAPGAARRAADNETIAALAETRGFPPPRAEELPAWRAMAELLLTKVGKWRRSVTVALGFGPDEPQAKSRMISLLAELESLEALAADMNRVRELPDPAYGPQRWEILANLLALLPICAAELELEFAARGETDFVGVARAALEAVGRPDSPSDLALALDYRIRHILVDEFQDTSQAQVELLERLTAGWAPGDGRTLFCVGDPMQSIYRFREADVGRFLKARRDGIGDIRLEPLQLSVNFRSQAALVDWVTATFASIFPETEDLQLGAVRFSPSDAWRPAREGPALTCTAVPRGDARAEALEVVGRIAGIRESEPDARIAVLVRGRRHLAEIGPALAEAGIGFQAVDVQPLARSPVVQDLIALTRALSHRADRPAWLALLRAPWCGLGLVSVSRVAGGAGDDVWRRLNDSEVTGALPPADRVRVSRLVDALAPAVALAGRRPLRRVVNGAWLALGGGATARSATDLVDAARFFEFLEAHETAGELDDPAELASLAEELFAAPDVEAGDRLQLMTVHKAKGLEFDHVLLPGLDRGLAGDAKRLLRWLEQVGGDGPELIFAPVEPLGEEKDPLHRALKDLDARRDALEQDRLLYVAATRAREGLHLFAGLGEDDPETGDPPEPPRKSPLARLWQAAGDAFLAGRTEGVVVDESPAAPASLRRLVDGWRPPPPARGPDWAAPPAPDAPAGPGVEYDWAGRDSRAVGIAVHRMLEVVARDGPGAWPEERIRDASGLVGTLLAEAGVAPSDLEVLRDRSLAALRRTLDDPRGRWILDASHDRACSEHAVSGFVEGHLVRGVVDRAFVDGEGTLWIVDFKAGRHEGADLEAFLDREQERYRGQLERYAALMAPLHGGPVRLGLYFPQHAGWREWAPASAGR